MPRIAVLIPCWNEALTIEKVVTDFRAVLPEADIYVYDNNSTDDTAEIAKRAGAIVVHEYPLHVSRYRGGLLRDDGRG